MISHALTHVASDPAAYLAASLIALLLAFRGLRKRSLTPSGALAAFTVGTLTLAQGIPFAVPLLFFYFTGSFLTRYKASVKRRFDSGYVQEGTGRGAVQVLCTSAVGTVLAMGARTPGGCTSALRDPMWMAYLAFYACNTADTWASELGVALAKRFPILITSGQRVPPGTNGGITSTGVGVSAGGGLMLGIVSSMAIRECFTDVVGGEAMAAWCMLFGFVGSMIDSILGATLQRTYYSARQERVVKKGEDDTTKCITGRDVLTNEQVNFVSSAMTAWGAYLLFAYVVYPAA